MREFSCLAAKQRKSIGNLNAMQQKLIVFMQRHGEWIALKVPHAMIYNNEHVLFRQEWLD